MAGSTFRHLVHSDWSKDQRGRWTALASHEGGHWHAVGPAPVGPLPEFVEHLVGLGTRAPTLAGFDFPIGLPAAYGAKAGFSGFREALPTFGTGTWERFFEVAATKEEIGKTRPFYPMRAGNAALAHLLDGHGVADIAALMRACEHGGNGLTPAGCMFWTLGAKQVGKAAVNGWQSVVRPAILQGAKLWPFEGDLPALAQAGSLVLAETYPGDAYGQLGLSFKGLSKRRQDDRAGVAPRLIAWAQERAVTLSDELRAAIQTGFSAEAGGDDGFDAVIGLFAMIAVVSGERPDGAPMTDAIRRWEGWILGRTADRV